MSSTDPSRVGDHDRAARRALRHWLGDAPATLAAFGAGHINTTWRVDSGSEAFVLQHVSDTVFPDPPRIARNQQRLFSLLGSGPKFPYQLPEPLVCDAGETLLKLAPSMADQSAAKGPEYWRLCRLIEPARTLQTLANVQQAEAAGHAFGAFQRLAAGIQGDQLEEVIPGFYELPHYLSLLDTVLQQPQSEQAVVDDGARARLLLEQVNARRARYRTLDYGSVCVIHGDCKVNNLLFAPERDTVTAILDLDTLMVRPWWLDYGDLVRSAVPDSDGRLRPDVFAALAAGFFAGRGALGAVDVAAAVQAPGYVAYMLVVRFLEDHLQGDRYFRVTVRGQNLERAERQFAQLQQFEEPEFQQHMMATLRQLV